MTERLLTAAAVAELLGVAPATVHDWIATGKLRAYRLGGTKRGRLRIPEGEVDAKLAEWSTMPPAPSVTSTRLV